MKRPHHPSLEAIDLTEGEKDKIMNDFLLPEPVLENATAQELTDLLIAVAHMYELTKVKSLEVWAERIQQAIKDTLFEGQQLPWKD